MEFSVEGWARGTMAKFTTLASSNGRFVSRLRNSAPADEAAPPITGESRPFADRGFTTAI